MWAAQAQAADTPALSARPARRRGLDQYIQRKQLDPLETYLPIVIQAQQQIEESGRLAPTNLVAAKLLLRTGPLLGIRENIRAIGEYAEQRNPTSESYAAKNKGSLLQDVINGVPFSTKSSTETGALVSNFFRLELYDGVLDIAAREKRELLPEKEVPLAAAKVQTLLAALAALLATVPEEELSRAKAFLAVVEAKAAEENAAAAAAAEEAARTAPPAPTGAGAAVGSEPAVDEEGEVESSETLASEALIAARKKSLIVKGAGEDELLLDSLPGQDN
ncbi:MAG: hypothetical protein WDW36_004456 [Sanguina aurantia]